MKNGLRRVILSLERVIMKIRLNGKKNLDHQFINMKYLFINFLGNYS